MSPKLFNLMLAYQRLDEALRLRLVAGSANTLEILRLRARKQGVKSRLKSVSAGRRPLPAA